MSVLWPQWREPLLDLVVFVVCFIHRDIVVAIGDVSAIDSAGTERLDIQYSFHDAFCGCFVSLWVRLGDNSGG